MMRNLFPYALAALLLAAAPAAAAGRSVRELPQTGSPAQESPAEAAAQAAAEGTLPIDRTMVVTFVIQDDSVLRVDTARLATALRPATDTIEEARLHAAAQSGAEAPVKRHFLPTRRRIDREVNRNKFVYKGETLLGLTASYGTLSSDDADMFPVFENIGISGSVASVNPFVGYFYRDNRCVGLRLGYSRIAGRIDTFGINLGDLNDLDLEIPWVDLVSNRFSAGLFHRSYAGLDDRGRFGLFGEFELSYSGGNNTFAYKSGEQLKHTESHTSTVQILFSPGVAVYAFPNVCVTLSFGLGGFKYTAIRQYDEAGEQIGSRDYSKLNFRLNLADIRIGMTIHLWNKKKDRIIEHP